MHCLFHLQTLKEIYESDFLLTFLDVKNSMPLATWYEKLRRSSVSRDRLSSSNISLSESSSTYGLPEGKNRKQIFLCVRKCEILDLASTVFQYQGIMLMAGLLAFAERSSLLRGRAGRRLASSRRPHGHVAVQAVTVERKGAVSFQTSTAIQPHCCPNTLVLRTFWIVNTITDFFSSAHNKLFFMYYTRMRLTRPSLFAA